MKNENEIFAQVGKKVDKAILSEFKKRLKFVLVVLIDECPVMIANVSNPEIIIKLANEKKYNNTKVSQETQKM